MARRVEIEAPAKINLRLEILAREETGYHGLETLFCALELADTLTVERAGDGLELAVEGDVDTGPPDDNLVARAARRFYAELGERPALRVTLRKRIPSGAGLGGGSSDAAAALLALNALHEAPFERAALLQWGIELGSDVPFFLGGSPLALAWSRGERLLALPPLPRRDVLVAHPGQPIETAGAFRELSDRRGGPYAPRAGALTLASLSGWEPLEATARNDFEPVAAGRLPSIAAGLASLRESGARLSLLAGSGACIFGTFETEADTRLAEVRLHELGFTCWRTATRRESPRPRVRDGHDPASAGQGVRG